MPYILILILADYIYYMIFNKKNIFDNLIKINNYN